MSRVRAKKRNLDDMDATTESQQMLALGEFMKKPRGDKEEIKQFRTKLARDQQEMKALLQQRFQQAKKEDTRRRNELVSLISEALQPPNMPRHRDNATFPNTSIGVNPVFESASKVNTACKSLVAEYNIFEAMIIDMMGDSKNQITEAWAQDVTETERQLRLGHKVALRNVKKVLGANVGGDGMGAADEEELEDDGTTVGELNYELLKSLRYTERGVKRMVKGLPKNE